MANNFLDFFRKVKNVCTIDGVGPVEEPKTETINGAAPKAVSKVKILIDNGHGNNTAGKKSPYSMHGVKPALEYEEWSWARDIAKEIVSRLKALGYDAERIVEEDKDIPLSTRATRVNALCNTLGKNNVILVSIHANAAGNGTKWMEGQGWEAYTTKGVTKSDKLADCLYAAAEKYFKDRKIRKDTSDGDADKESDFYIIKNTYCPAVLTENFFYDNIKDLKYILSEEGKENVIKAHVEGIINYLEG